MNHWSGVEITCQVTTTMKRLILFLEKRQSLGLKIVVTNYRGYTIKGQRCSQKLWNSSIRSTQVCRWRSYNIKLARQCLNFWKESKTLMSSWKKSSEQRQTQLNQDPFEENVLRSQSAKLGISKRYIYTLKQWIIQIPDFFPSDPESSVRILTINRLQDPRSRKARQIYPVNLSTKYSAEFENFLHCFPQKTLSELEKNGSAFFQSRPRVKVELTRAKR